MSRITKKITMHNENREKGTAEILIYPDGVKLVVRDEYQYPIFGKSLGSETSAKRFLSVHFGKGWKKSSEIIYTWERLENGKIRINQEFKR